MKLTLKLALALLPAALLVVAAAAFFELRRDRAEFEADQRGDDRATAHAFAEIVGNAWEAAGGRPVRQAIERLRAFEARYRVSWLEVGAAPKGERPAVPKAARAALAGGAEVLWRDDDSTPPGWFHAASPVWAGGVVVGAVDVAEPPPDLRAHIRGTIRATAISTVVLSATMMMITLVIGAWLVGRPITGLIGQARRVAAGDLGARSVPRQRDELGELTHELNKMLERLESATEEVRRSTRQRFEALEQLQHAQRLTTVGRLASSVAHELGTPLNVVAGRARLIVEHDGPAEPHAAVIIGQAERMTKIIRQLLDYARRRLPQKDGQDLARVAADVVALLATLASKRRIALQFRAAVTPAPITADATQIQQAVTNLIVNAIQASADGGTVDVTLRPADPAATPPGQRRDPPRPPANMFELAVQDHGAGMPPEVLARVFEPFFTTKPVGESTGLGLSVAQDIVEEHGGWIQAESAPGRGSRFFLFVPRSAS